MIRGAAQDGQRLKVEALWIAQTIRVLIDEIRDISQSILMFKLPNFLSQSVDIVSISDRIFAESAQSVAHAPFIRLDHKLSLESHGPVVPTSDITEQDVIKPWKRALHDYSP